MREKCYEVFMNFLQNTSQHIKDGQVSDEIIKSYREQMKTMRVRANMPGVIRVFPKSTASLKNR